MPNSGNQKGRIENIRKQTQSRPNEIREEGNQESANIGQSNPEDVEVQPEENQGEKQKI